MDYNSTLQFLQNLLTNKQTTQGTQFNQNLGQTQANAAQQLGEFNTQAALQKSLQEWQQNLQQQQQNQGQQAQTFEEGQQAQQTSPQYISALDLIKQSIGGGTPAPNGNVGVGLGRTPNSYVSTPAGYFNLLTPQGQQSWRNYQNS